MHRPRPRIPLALLQVKSARQSRAAVKQRPATATAALTAAGLQSRSSDGIGAAAVGGRQLLLRGNSLGGHSLLDRNRVLSSSSHAAATAAEIGGAVRAPTWLHRSMTTAADGETWCLLSSGSGGGLGRGSSSSFHGGSGRGSSTGGGGDGGGARGSSSVAAGAHRGSGRRETDLERLSRMVSSGPGQGMSRESPCIS